MHPCHCTIPRTFPACRAETVYALKIPIPPFPQKHWFLSLHVVSTSRRKNCILSAFCSGLSLFSRGFSSFIHVADSQIKQAFPVEGNLSTRQPQQVSITVPSIHTFRSRGSSRTHRYWLQSLSVSYFVPQTLPTPSYETLDLFKFSYKNEPVLSCQD